MFQSFSHYTKQIFIVAAECLVAVIVTSLVASYAAGVIKDTSARLVERRIISLANEHQSQFSLNLQKDRKSVSAYLDRLDAAVPSEENLGVFQSAVGNLAESLAGGGSASFRFVGNEPAPGVGPFKKTSFKIVVNCPPAAFKTYLKQVEGLPFFIELDSIDSTLSDGTGQYVITGQVYVQ